MQQWKFIIYLSAVLFLPLLPAYILYKLLPSDTSVGGPFQGLSVNLTGAFAGYFLLVVVASGFAYKALTPPKPTHEIWKITGKVKPRVIDPHTGDEIIDIAGVTISLSPSYYTIDSQGKFTLETIVTPGHVEGTKDYPTLIFNRPSYAQVLMKVNPADNTDYEFSEDTKEIRVKNVVTMDKLREKTEELKWPR